MTEPKYADKYWLCSACAIEQGAKHTGDVCTVIRGLCGHCKCGIEETLTPWVDFDWGDKSKNRIAKASRD